MEPLLSHSSVQVLVLVSLLSVPVSASVSLQAQPWKALPVSRKLLAISVRR